MDIDNLLIDVFKDLGNKERKDQRLDTADWSEEIGEVRVARREGSE
jgi:hypothetical protein